MKNVGETFLSVPDALLIMIAFAALITELISVIVSIIIALKDPNLSN